MYTLFKTSNDKVAEHCSCNSKGARAPIVLDLWYQLRPGEFKPL